MHRSAFLSYIGIIVLSCHLEIVQNDSLKTRIEMEFPSIIYFLKKNVYKKLFTAI